MKQLSYDGFSTVTELSLSEWLAHETEDYGEYIHLFYHRGNRQLRVYRSVGEVGEHERIMTVIDDVTLRVHGDDPEPSHFYLTDVEAMTFMTFLTALKWERSPARVSLTYYADTGRPMMAKYNVVEETLYAKYHTDSGRENEVAIHSLYENYVQRIAKFK